MSQEIFGITLSAVLAILYLMMGYLATQRGAGFGRTTQIMIFYAIVASIWQLGAAYLGYGITDLPLVNAWGHAVGVLLLNVLMLAATIEFINQDRRYKVFVGIGAVWSLLIILAMAGLIRVPENLIPTIFWLILLGSELMLVVALRLTFQILRIAERVTVKRRAQFWLVALLLLLPADMIAFLSNEPTGDLLRFASIVISGFLVFIHSPTDLLWTIRRIFAFWFGSVIVFAVLLIIGRFRADATPDLHFWVLPDVFLDGFFAFYLYPAVVMMAGLLNRSLLGMGQDQGTRARAFSSKISTSLSLQVLTQTVIEELNQLFVLDFSNLVIVDRQEEDRIYHLRTISLQEYEVFAQPVEPGMLSYDSPLVRFFIEKKTPVERSDAAWLLFYNEIPEEQRTWLDSLSFELLVPILLHDHLVGILAMGPKKSQERFYPADISLAGLLAEQMGAIIVNASLLDNTLRLNLELKSAQDEILKSNEKLRELDEMKTAFIGVITHELRTPLANIQFASQVLEMYYKQAMTTKQREQFDELNAAVKLARSMIDNLINFAAFLNEKVTLNVKEFDFSHSLKEVLLPHKAAMESKKLRLQVNMIGDRFMVHADAKLVKEAVNQLVSNAIRFTRSGIIHVVCWTTADALCIDVEDTGIGIEEERLNQVWDAFSQLQADPVKRGIEGLGLGLSLVKYIVKAHGGHVWLESSVGAGSTFGFQIPLAGPEHALPNKSSRPQRLQLPQS